MTDRQEWEAAGFNEKEREQWTRAGFSIAQASQWNEVLVVPAIQAKNWRDRGFTDTMAAEWINMGFHCVRKAAEWRDLGFSPSEAFGWETAHFSPEHAFDWATSGFAPTEAFDWCHRGFSATRAETWRGCCTARLAQECRARNVGPKESGAWFAVGLWHIGTITLARCRGYTPESFAAYCKTHTVTPNDVIEGRIALPSKGNLQSGGCK